MSKYPNNILIRPLCIPDPPPQNDIRKAERPLPKLPLPLRPETWTTPQFNYLSGQVVTELNPAPSPSGHPLLSGPPT